MKIIKERTKKCPLIKILKKTGFLIKKLPVLFIMHLIPGKLKDFLV